MAILIFIAMIACILGIWLAKYYYFDDQKLNAPTAVAIVVVLLSIVMLLFVNVLHRAISG